LNICKRKRTTKEKYRSSSHKTNLQLQRGLALTRGFFFFEMKNTKIENIENPALAVECESKKKERKRL
jgi:hypothetical protein